MGVQGVGVLDRLLPQLQLQSQRAGHISTVTIPALVVVDAPHVHDVAVHPPSQEPVGQRGEEAAVGGKRVGGEEVRVRGHGEEERLDLLVCFVMGGVASASQIWTNERPLREARD